MQGSSISKYHGIGQATKTIVKEEGVKALWSVPVVAISVLEENGNDTCTRKMPILNITFLHRKGLTPGLLLYFTYGGVQVWWGSAKFVYVLFTLFCCILM